MSVAIVTKFHGPTNYRGARITHLYAGSLADGYAFVFGPAPVEEN